MTADVTIVLVDEQHTSLKEQVTSLRTGGSREKPRLHKPLLVLLLLSRYIESGSTVASFADIEGDLTLLINKYTPSASQARPHYPFWRLQTDGFWEVANASDVALNSSGDPTPRSLTAQHSGSWTARAVKQLKGCNPQELVDAVLNRYFAATDRDALLQDLGLSRSPEG